MNIWDIVKNVGTGMVGAPADGFDVTLNVDLNTVNPDLATSIARVIPDLPCRYCFSAGHWPFRTPPLTFLWRS